MTDEIQKAANELLQSASSETATPSAQLIDTVERKNPGLSGDVVRDAYWRLVSDGSLERTGSGVRRTAPHTRPSS